MKNVAMPIAVNTRPRMMRAMVAATCIDVTSRCKRSAEIGLTSLTSDERTRFRHRLTCFTASPLDRAGTLARERTVSRIHYAASDTEGDTYARFLTPGFIARVVRRIGCLFGID